MITWKDISSHSQNEKDRTPKTWECRAGVFRLIVTRHIHYKPDQWVARCDGVFDGLALTSKDIEMAKSEAIHVLTGYLGEAQAAFGPDQPLPEFHDENDE